jgi:hypothetical protein
MSDNNIKLLTVWYYKSKLYYSCHRDSSDYYELLNKMLGLPAILINVINTTSLFSNYSQINEMFILIIAVLSLISTMLTACQNYFEFNKLKNDHRKLMIQYSKVIYSIEKILIKNDESEITEDKMNNILNLFEKLREEYIFFPEKIWKNNNLIYISKLNSLNVNTTDSINIILSSIKKNKNFLFDDETSKEYNESKNSEIITYSNKIQENTTKSIEESKDNNDIDKIQYLV